MGEGVKRHTCRVCDSGRLRVVCDFGPQPLAGEFPLVPNSKRAAKRYPLDLTQCDDCGLLQVTNLPPIDEIFHADYRYSSSTVPALVQHFTGYADWLAQRFAPKSSVLEFGCNDGVLLAQLQERGFVCVGVDASDNVADIGRQRGIRIHSGFMTEELVSAQNLAGRFDVVTCSNVFAHIDNVKATLGAVRLALMPGGHFIVEVHDGVALARDAQFETVYHEHLTYFTEHTLRRLVEPAGFEFVECHQTPMHGGGLRFVCRRADVLTSTISGTRTGEQIDGVRFTDLIRKCTNDIADLAAEFGPLDGFGAAGRSQMFINMTSTAHHFAQVFDDSPLRQNRYIVGTDVPIRPFAPPLGAACVILAWNYAPSISARLTGHYKRVITLLPERKVW